MSIKTIAAGFLGRWLSKKINLQEGGMSETKKWYQSKGVWTGIVATLVGLYGLLDANVAPALGFDMPDIPSIVFTVLGAMGIYARTSANKKIG